MPEGVISVSWLFTDILKEKKKQNMTNMRFFMRDLDDMLKFVLRKIRINLNSIL